MEFPSDEQKVVRRLPADQENSSATQIPAGRDERKNDKITNKMHKVKIDPVIKVSLIEQTKSKKMFGKEFRELRGK